MERSISAKRYDALMLLIWYVRRGQGQVQDEHAFGLWKPRQGMLWLCESSLAWCYLQSTLFNPIHVLQSKKEYTQPRRVNTKAY